MAIRTVADALLAQTGCSHNNMIRTIVLLCLAAPAFGLFGKWSPGLKIKYGTNMFAIGTDNLIDLARSNNSALTEGYIRMNRPRLPPGYCPMQLWCRKDDLMRVCVLTDETGDVAGIQYNLPVDEFKPKYDMKEQGFTLWTTVLDNTIVRYYAFFQFFVAADSQRRIESKNADTILREKELFYSGFGGQLASIATETSQLYSIFTKQNCIGWLGNQYYYNMTKEQECSASTMSPFSAMFSSGDLIGTRISVIGTWVKNSKYKDLYENMNTLSVMYAVPNGPKCLFSDIKEGGVAMTFYFTSTPWLINCIFS